jgi:hypothetical protein
VVPSRREGYTERGERGNAASVHPGDARVRVVATGLDTYPDVTVVCGREERTKVTASHSSTPS